MLADEIAGRVLSKGLECGADFSELFIEETRSTSVQFKDRKVESARSGVDFGIGVRLIASNQVFYGHTNRTDLDSLLAVVTRIGHLIQDPGRVDPANSKESRLLASLSESPWLETNYQDLHPVRIWPGPADRQTRLDILHAADTAARALSARVEQVGASVNDSITRIQIFNSEGLHVSDKRCRTRFAVQVTASHDGQRFTAHETPGRMQGVEFLQNLDSGGLAVLAGERALRMLDAGYITGGQMPVVMANGFGGVIFHEACGHPLESESVRKESSPFCNRLGQQIAHPAVTAIDDGTVPHAWGSVNIDDEGMPTERTVLIENGILKSFITDRIGASELQLPRTGNARRQSYEYAPVSRMRNTWIAPGEHTPADLIASVDNGLYAKKMGGGSVNPATGEFNFAVEEAWLIQNGRLGAAVRGASLVGKGSEILHRISMVADDLELAAGMCGASSGAVPVCVGQPSLRVDQILVGGR